MARPLATARTVVDVLRASRDGPSGLARRRDARLSELVAWARTGSPYYRRLYRDLPHCGDLPQRPVALGDFPAVTKADLMAAFDDWVTDPRVTLAGVEAFKSDPGLAGAAFLDRYFVCSTSGTTGHPGLFVHDPGALAVYQALSLRLDLAWLSGSQWLQILRRRGRWAAVVATGGHFAGEGWMEVQRRTGSRTVSVLPLAVASILDETPGVRNSQLVQTGPVSLELRLELKQGAGEGTAMSALENLRVFLADQGLPNVGVALSPAAPERTPRSGKYRQVVALPRTAAQ